MDLPGGPARFDAEFIAQDPVQAPVGRQGLGAAAGAVEDEHQLLVEGLAQRVLVDEPGEFGDEPGPSAQVQIRVEAPLKSLQPRLLPPLAHRVGVGEVGQFGQRGAPPQRQGG